MPTSDDLTLMLLKTLTGSAALGDYPDTLADRLDDACEAGWALVNKLGLTAPVIAGTAPGPFVGTDTPGHAVIDQVKARYKGAAETSKPRNMVERAQQIDALVSVLSPVLNGRVPGPVDAPADDANLLWAATYNNSTMTQCGFREIQVQNSVSNDSIRTNKDDFPVGDTPIGRAIIFAMDNGQVRREGNPNKGNSLDGSGTSYHSLRFYLESGFPVEVNDWQLIWQAHGNDTTSPKFALQLRNNELRIGDNKGGWSPRIETQKPYSVILKCDRGAGKISVWVNGSWCLSDYTCGKSATPYYQKNGWYHTVRIRGGKMYQNGHAMGKTFNSVAHYL